MSAVGLFCLGFGSMFGALQAARGHTTLAVLGLVVAIAGLALAVFSERRRA